MLAPSRRRGRAIRAALRPRCECRLEDVLEISSELAPTRAGVSLRAPALEDAAGIWRLAREAGARAVAEVRAEDRREEPREGPRGPRAEGHDALGGRQPAQEPQPVLAAARMSDEHIVPMDDLSSGRLSEFSCQLRLVYCVNDDDVPFEPITTGAQQTSLGALDAALLSLVLELEQAVASPSR